MIERITAGLDWISCTLGKDEEGYQLWKGNALYALEKVCDAGYVLVPRKLLGFEGLSAGNCFVGENETNAYAQFSGEKADWAYDFLSHPNAHYSRIDAQVTVKRDVMDLKEGRRCLNAANRANADLPSGRKRNIRYMAGSDGGFTLYVGAASSTQSCRIYNKEVQSEDITYSRCWRYEVVLRNELSTQLAHTLANTTAARADFCVSFCTAWLAKRGVHIRGLEHSRGAALPIERTMPTDVERKLRWLKEQVQPSVEYLIGLGFRDAVLELLGLIVKSET